MKVKVCGMRDWNNILSLAELAPDFMGFIFYAKSPRFVEEQIPRLDTKIQKVGVFVNSEKEEILKTAKAFELECIQLHGSESPDLCTELKDLGYTVFKAFSVDSDFDFSQVKVYNSAVDYYLFDTKTDQYGGAGVAFNWNLLNNYKENVPFFIAGGISNENIDELLLFKHPAWAGLDLNSKFEISPAYKDIEALKMLFDKVKMK